MQSEWIISFFIILIIIQIFIILGITQRKKRTKSYKKKCFKESFDSTNTTLLAVFQKVYDENINRYMDLKSKNANGFDLNESLKQIVLAGEKLGKSKDEIKKELDGKGLKNIDI